MKGGDQTWENGAMHPLREVGMVVKHGIGERIRFRGRTPGELSRLALLHELSLLLGPGRRDVLSRVVLLDLEEVLLGVASNLRTRLVCQSLVSSSLLVSSFCCFLLTWMTVFVPT